MSIEWPLTSLLLATSMLFFASALRRVGEKIDAPPIVSRARWVQGLIVVTASSQLGFAFAMVAYQSTRWNYPRSDAGGVVAVLIAIVAGLTTLTVIVLHVSLAFRGRKALRAYASRGPTMQG